jgi:hypothetical protein
MTNVGLWDRWYAGLTEPAPFGDTRTYRDGADWLADCALIEDWGCGKGWMRRFVSPDRYRGIDGSTSPFADEVVDLATYRSDVPAVFMRHVLEHNHDWATILANALASAHDRLFVVLFTPLVDTTQEIAYAEDPGVPDIAFHLPDITDHMTAAGFDWQAETISTATQYGVETLLRCQR